MKDYLEELLLEQEQQDGESGENAPEWALLQGAKVLPGRGRSRRDETERGGGEAAAEAEMEAPSLPEREDTWRTQVRWAAETAQRWGAFQEREERPQGPERSPAGGAEGLYRRVRTASEAAAWRGHAPAAEHDVEIGQAGERDGADLERLDRALERDARRYDNGFELY